MYVTKIKLRRYRNIYEAEVIPARGVTVLRGDNGQGKTNLLEAVNVFSLGRPYRTRREKELIYGIGGGRVVNGRRLGPGESSDFAEAALTFADDKGRETVTEITWFLDGTKRIIREGARLKPSELIGRFRAVLFSPDDLTLVKEGPSGRRAFFDFAVSQLDQKYLASLTRYNHILSQRNALLRGYKTTDGSARAALPAYTPYLAREAAYITKVRGRYLELFSASAESIYSDMTGGQEKFAAAYLGQRTEEEFAQLFQDFESRDIEYGTTTTGPHRDDYSLLLNGVPARQMASQGQQRSIVLSMKLAQGEVMKASSGEYPVFLFDDVLSEIDSRRREYLLGSMKEGDRQMIITTCEKNIPGDMVYEVEKGKFIQTAKQFE